MLDTTIINLNADNIITSISHSTNKILNISPNDSILQLPSSILDSDNIEIERIERNDSCDSAISDFIPPVFENFSSITLVSKEFLDQKQRFSILGFPYLRYKKLVANDWENIAIQDMTIYEIECRNKIYHLQFILLPSGNSGTLLVQQLQHQPKLILREPTITGPFNSLTHSTKRFHLIHLSMFGIIHYVSSYDCEILHVEETPIMKYVAEDQLEDFCALLAVGQKVPFIGFRFWFAFEGVMRVYKCLLSRLESSMALLLVDETDIEDCNCDKKGNDSCESIPKKMEECLQNSDNLHLSIKEYRVMNAKLYLFMENRCYKPLVSLSNRSLTVLNFVTQILHDFMPHFERLVATDLKTFNVTRITRDSVLAWCLYRSILHDIVKQRNENIIMIINDLLNIPS